MDGLHRGEVGVGGWVRRDADGIVQISDEHSSIISIIITYSIEVEASEIQKKNGDLSQETSQGSIAIARTAPLEWEEFAVVSR